MLFIVLSGFPLPPFLTYLKSVTASVHPSAWMLPPREDPLPLPARCSPPPRTGHRALRFPGSGGTDRSGTAPRSLRRRCFPSDTGGERRDYPGEAPPPPSPPSSHPGRPRRTRSPAGKSPPWVRRGGSRWVPKTPPRRSPVPVRPSPVPPGPAGRDGPGRSRLPGPPRRRCRRRRRSGSPAETGTRGSRTPSSRGRCSSCCRRKPRAVAPAPPRQRRKQRRLRWARSPPTPRCWAAAAASTKGRRPTVSFPGSSSRPPRAYPSWTGSGVHELVHANDGSFSFGLFHRSPREQVWDQQGAITCCFPLCFKAWSSRKLSFCSGGSFSMQ